MLEIWHLQQNLSCPNFIEVSNSTNQFHPLLGISGLSVTDYKRYWNLPTSITTDSYGVAKVGISYIRLKKYMKKEYHYSFESWKIYENGHLNRTLETIIQVASDDLSLTPFGRGHLLLY